jgi:hypothetical protein
MGLSKSTRRETKHEEELTAQLSAEVEGVAWELVDAGRYMPRRIRGSFRGRELG